MRGKINCCLHDYRCIKIGCHPERSEAESKDPSPELYRMEWILRLRRLTAASLRMTYLLLLSNVNNNLSHRKGRETPAPEGERELNLFVQVHKLAAVAAINRFAECGIMDNPAAMGTPAEPQYTAKENQAHQTEQNSKKDVLVDGENRSGSAEGNAGEDRHDGGNTFCHGKNSFLGHNRNICPQSLYHCFSGMKRGEVPQKTALLVEKGGGDHSNSIFFPQHWQ